MAGDSRRSPTFTTSQARRAGVQFRALTDEVPPAVQIAVAKGTWRPRIAYPPVQVFAWHPDTIGLQVQQVETASGEPVRVYSAARTVRLACHDR